MNMFETILLNLVCMEFKNMSEPENTEMAAVLMLYMQERLENPAKARAALMAMNKELRSI